MRPEVLWTALAVLLGGCLGNPTGDDPGPDVLAHGSPSDTPRPGLKKTTSDQVRPLVLPDVRDDWGGASELVLFNAAVQAETCGLVSDNGNTLWVEWEKQVPVGCAILSLPKGRLLPEGTNLLRVEADASKAQRVGSYQVAITQTQGNTVAVAPATAEAVHTFAFKMEPKDWDLPDSHPSRLRLEFRPTTGGADPGLMLLGPLHVKLIAERDPAWTPKAWRNFWEDPVGSSRTADGAIVVHEEQRSLRSATTQEILGGRAEAPRVELAHVIPFGTEQLVVGFRLSNLTSCPAGEQCKIFASIQSGGQRMESEDSVVWESGPEHEILVFDSPKQAAHDNQYVAKSATTVHPRLEPCVGLGYFLRICDFATTSAEVEVSLRIEAWRGDADLSAFRARLGLV